MTQTTIGKRKALFQKLDKAESSQKMLGYLFVEQYATPAKDFVDEYQLFCDSNITRTYINWIGYEVVSPELKDAISSLRNALIMIHWYEERGSKYETESAEIEKDYAKSKKRLLLAMIKLLPLPELNSEKDLNLAKKAMLIAALKEDKKSFIKAFKAFEKNMCNKYPEQYAPGLAWIDPVYNQLSRLELSEPDMDCLLDFNKSKEFDIKKYFDTCDNIALNPLNNQKVYVVDNWKDPGIVTKKEINAFVLHGIKILKSELERNIAEKKAVVANLQHTHNKKVLKETTGTLKYIGRWCWSCVFSFKVHKDDASDSAKKLLDAQKSLDDMQSKLKEINAAKGYFRGYYYTPEIKSALSDRFNKPGTNMYKSIGAKKTEETFIKSYVIRPIQSAWTGIKLRFKSLKNRVMNLYHKGSAAQNKDKEEAGNNDKAASVNGATSAPFPSNQFSRNPERQAKEDPKVASPTNPLPGTMYWID